MPSEPEASINPSMEMADKKAVVVHAYNCASCKSASSTDVKLQQIKVTKKNALDYKKLATFKYPGHAITDIRAVFPQAAQPEADQEVSAR